MLAHNIGHATVADRGRLILNDPEVIEKLWSERPSAQNDWLVHATTVTDAKDQCLSLESACKVQASGGAGDLAMSVQWFCRAGGQVNH